MCGICGIYSKKVNQEISPNLQSAMLWAIRHRGPDDQGSLTEQNIFLGMRRLSIIDLDGGHQPMSNEDGSIWIVFNGEIYNYKDLRATLSAKGHVFRTQSDTETIIHAYEEWGIDGFARLNGMYGFALWDRKRKELVLARDPFGVKPLYYFEQHDRFVFGSEIKAILVDPDVPRSVDSAALDQFLTFSFVPSPRTLFEGIKKVPPGYALCVTPEGSRKVRFYRPKITTPTMSGPEWLEALQDGIEKAIVRQMVADVPVGVMLSGGIDSATVAMLARIHSGQPIHSFTVGFSGDFKKNELAQGRRSAELIGTTHHEVIISANDFMEFLPKAIWYLDEPIASPASLPTYWVSKLAREYVKVVLTGQGADEPFAGYARHLGAYYGRWFRMAPEFVRKRFISPFINRLPRTERFKRAVRTLDISDPVTRLTQIYHIFESELKQRLYRSELLDEIDTNFEPIVREWWEDAKHLSELNQMAYVDARFSLADNLLLYGDKMAMAASLEARVPFLDLDLMLLVEGMPAKYKIRGLTQKYLLKKAVAKWLPPEIIQRKKIGFETPVDQWFGGELRSYLSDLLLRHGSGCSLFFNLKELERMITDHTNKHRDYQRHLFSLITFELWYQTFIVNPIPTTDYR